MTKMEYYDANSYFRSRFGSKVYKAAISLDVTCPNRDGTKGYGGCIFCSSGGSGEFASSKLDSVTKQIDNAIARLSAKVPENSLYIAYFQSFTSTHCKPDYLRKALVEAASHEKVCAISIATRPDSLPEEILNVIEEVNGIIPVMVELGLQTKHDVTANWFRRCFRSVIYEDAMKALKDRGIEVITHIIFGLKGETEEMMLDSVRYAVDNGTDGLKFTCLYILKNTDLEKEWAEGRIQVLGMDEYFDIVAKALSIVPSDIVIHRLTGDGPRSLLIEPQWTINKRCVINYIRKRFGTDSTSISAK